MSKQRQRSVESSISVIARNETENSLNHDRHRKRRRDGSLPQENHSLAETSTTERPNQIQASGSLIPQTYENLLQNELVRRQVLERDDDSASSVRVSDDDLATAALSERSQRYRRRSASVRSANREENSEEQIDLPGDYCTGVEYDSQLLVARFERRERSKGVYRRRNLTGFDSKLTTGLLVSFIEQKKIPMVERFFGAMKTCLQSKRSSDADIGTELFESSSSLIFCEQMERELEQIARDNKLSYCRLNWERLLKDRLSKKTLTNGSLDTPPAPVVVSDVTTAEPPSPPEALTVACPSSPRIGIRQRIADEAAAIRERENTAILNDYVDGADEDTSSKTSSAPNRRGKVARADEDEAFLVTDADFLPAVDTSGQNSNSDTAADVIHQIDAVNLAARTRTADSAFLASSPLAATQAEIYAHGDPQGAPVPPPDSYLYRTFEIAGATVKRWMVNVCSSYNCEIEIDLVKFSFEVKSAMFEPDLFPGLRWKVPGSSIGCSLFANGWIVCAGGQAFAENAKVVALVLKVLRDLGMRPRTDAELRIDSLTFGFEFSFAIRLSRFKNEHTQFTRYEPETFAGLIYHMVKPVKCTWILFANGRAVLVGLKRLEDSVAAAQAFVPLAMKHKF